MIPFRSNELARRQLNALGDPATLKQYTISGQDVYGDDEYTLQTNDITVILSTVTNTRVPFERRGDLGFYYVMQVEFFTMDDVPVPNTATEKPPTLTHKGLEYEILEVEDSQIGILRFVAYRRRE